MCVLIRGSICSHTVYKAKQTNKTSILSVFESQCFPSVSLSTQPYKGLALSSVLSFILSLDKGLMSCLIVCIKRKIFSVGHIWGQMDYLYPHIIKTTITLFPKFLVCSAFLRWLVLILFPCEPIWYFSNHIILYNFYVFLL